MHSFCPLLLGQRGSAGETKAEGEQRGFGVVGRSTGGHWALGSLAGRLPVAGRPQNDTQREDRVCRPPPRARPSRALGRGWSKVKPHTGATTGLGRAHGLDPQPLQGIMQRGKSEIRLVLDKKPRDRANGGR